MRPWKRPSRTAGRQPEARFPCSARCLNQYRPLQEHDGAGKWRPAGRHCLNPLPYFGHSGGVTGHVSTARSASEGPDVARRASRLERMSAGAVVPVPRGLFA
jgi:hypothetical protein